MKILIINGSPKGDYSVTYHHTLLIQKELPAHEYDDVNIAKGIKGLERSSTAFAKIMKKVEWADLLVWASPVYFNLVPSQLKRFIELISERNYDGLFVDKYCAIVMTSIHFHDQTALNYLQGVSEDLGMKMAGRYSAYSLDFEKKESQVSLIEFAKRTFSIVENEMPVEKRFQKMEYKRFVYNPAPVMSQIKTEKKIVIITDNMDPNSNLTKMVNRFANSFSGPVEIVNITELTIKGGCLGCIKCAIDYTCVYEGGKDEFNEMYRKKILGADIVVMAGEMKDRYLSSRWKMFYDRNFFHNHAPYLIKKQLIYLISGPFKQNQNLRQLFESWSEAEKVAALEFVSDDGLTSEELDWRISTVAAQAAQLSKNYQVTQSFLGVGGMKIFRDELYGRIRFPFVADYAYYKEHGLFDFEHNKLKYKLQYYIMMILMKFPKVRDKMLKKEMKEQMIKPYRKVIAKELSNNKILH